MSRTPAHCGGATGPAGLPFPAGVNDCYAALDWIAGNAGGQGLDGRRIIVGGGSAGGCLVDVGSVDTLRDETLDYTRRIWGADGVAEMHVWPGAYPRVRADRPEFGGGDSSAGGATTG